MPLSVQPRHLLLFVLIMAIWGLNFVVAKIGLARIPPILLMALRFALVAAILVPFVAPPRGRWGRFLLLSVTLGFLHFALMFSGLKHLDAATAAIAIQLQVPFAAVLAALFLGDRLGWRRGVGMAIAFAGVVVIAGEPRLEGNLTSLLLVISAACIWSVANLQVKLLGEVDGMTLNAWIALFATPQLALASFLLEDGQWAALAGVDWWAVFSIFYQAVFVVVFGYGAWYRLMRHYEMNQVMPFTLLVPLFGVLSGVVFLDEALTLPLLLGGLLTVVGVAVIVLGRPKRAAPPVQRT